MQVAPRPRQASSQSNGMPSESRIASINTTRVNQASVPLGNISNRIISTSSPAAAAAANNDNMSRKPSRTVLPASEGSSSYERDDSRGSRSSIGGRRSFSGAKVGPSAFRRLPPGAVPRSVVPSLNNTEDAMRDRVASGSSGRGAVAALARVNQTSSGPRRSLGQTINAAASGGIAQHDREVREVGKLNVSSTNFEEWMKMATDNKINVSNTWNFALIDYFHDMSLLRSDNGDGTINFQKASCTLDGCVKVWTSRVDSVVVETGKLLSGLQDEGKENNKNSRTRGGEVDEEEGVEEDEEGDTVVKKKRTRTKEPTLAKSFAHLAVKKLDLEFTVDPLFKKTSADFDEGGAGGLLMNHLGVDSNARVVFDAGDVAGIGEDEIVEPLVGEEQAMDNDEEEENPAFADQVDLYKLRNKLFSQFDGLDFGEDDALGSLLSDLVICPTFSSFKFAPGDDTPFSALALNNAESTPQPFTGGEFLPALEENDGEDDFNDMPAFDYDGQDDAFGGADPFGGGPTGYEDEVQEYDENGIEIDGREVIPADAPIDFATAFRGITDEQGMKLNGDGFFDYFDQRLTKNWAGPEHWKMRNLGLGAPPGQQRGDMSTGNGAEKTARKSKEPFVVDFCSEEGAVSAKQIFEKGGAAITLPQQKDTSAMDLYLLPEDRHFTSRQLLRLFIKPRAMLNLRRKGVRITNESQENGPHQADLDEAYWAQAAAAREGSRGAGTGSEYADAEDGGLGFDTPFFHDAEDDGGFDGLDEGGAGGLDIDAMEEDEELATQALKRIRPEFVNYAKKAKRVDVRKLKENIWKQLAIEAMKGDGSDEEDKGKESDDDDDDGEEGQGDKSATPKATKKAARISESLEPRVFQSVLSGLRKTYPKDRMDEISTSFCFICLLHLANEEGLQISTAEAQNSAIQLQGILHDDAADDALGEEEEESERKGEERVGFLEQLSIVKDPNAGRSA